MSSLIPAIITRVHSLIVAANLEKAEQENSQADSSYFYNCLIITLSDGVWLDRLLVVWVPFLVYK